MSSQTRNISMVLAVVAVLGGFWFALLAPTRTEAGAVTDQIAQAEVRRDAALAAAAQAEQARARYQDDYATVARLGKAVPADDDVASLVYQLETIARANKIDFRVVKLTGAGGQAAAPAATAPDASSADKDADASEGEDASKGADGAGAGDPADSAAPAAPVIAQPPPGAVVGTAGLLTVPFSFTFDGGYMQMQRFLKAINGLANSKKGQITVRGRLLTVDGFSLSASREGFPKVKGLVSATAYLAPPNDPAAAAATAQAPAGAPAATTALTTQDAQGGGR